MSRLKIKNFGPIKQGPLQDEGWIDISKVTLFMGHLDRGSIMSKLISIFLGIEKALFCEDFKEREFDTMDLKNIFYNYKMNNYLKEGETEMLYESNFCDITYSKEGILSIIKKTGRYYPLPQIVYIPSERNLISVFDNETIIKDLSTPLISLLDEYDKAKSDIKDKLELPINNTTLEYQKTDNKINILCDNYKINLKDASGGFQSLVPLYLVSWHLAQSVKRQKETCNEAAFINIVEEPEQSLDPVSQNKIFSVLLRFNNYLSDNKLIITTHSPYIINYLSLSVKAGLLKDKATTKQKEEISKMFPVESSVKGDDIRIYEVAESGEIILVGNYKGFPSDENYLNEQIEETNILFSKLLTLEDSWK